MFLLDFLPNWFFHLITILGLGALLVTYFLSNIPVIGKYVRQIQFAGIICALLGIWFEGGITNDNRWRARVSELEIKIAQAEAASANLNAQLTQQIANNQILIKENTIAQRERLKAEAALLNQECKVSNRVISIINDAAANRQGVTK